MIKNDIIASRQKKQQQAVMMNCTPLRHTYSRVERVTVVYKIDNIT